MTPALALTLIILHSIDGYEVTIAPQQVTSLRAGKPGRSNELLIQGVNCVVGLTDGKFITVVENCREVRTLLEGK